MGFALFFGAELLLFAIFSLIKFDNKKQVNICLGLMFFLMFIFSAMRGSGDGDYYNYLWFAKDIGTDSSKLFNFSYPVEFSFRLISYVINSLDISRQWVIALMNLFSILPVFYVTAKKSKKPFLSAIIFMPLFLQFDMQTSRTATAIGLGLLSLNFMTEKRRILALVFLALAVSFHRSALILLPFLIYIEIDLSNISKTLLVLASFVVSIFSKLMFGILAKILSLVGFGRMATKIINYTFSGRFAYAMKIYDPRIILGLLLFVVSIMYFNKQTYKKHSMESAAIKAMCYGLCVMLIFRSSTAIAFRFSSFFTIMQMFFIPMAIEKTKEYDPLATFMIVLSVVLFIIPYAIFIMVGSPAYDFFFTNLQAITSLR